MTEDQLAMTIASETQSRLSKQGHRTGTAWLGWCCTEQSLEDIQSSQVQTFGVASGQRSAMIGCNELSNERSEELYRRDSKDPSVKAISARDAKCSNLAQARQCTVDCETGEQDKDEDGVTRQW